MSVRPRTSTATIRKMGRRGFLPDKSYDDTRGTTNGRPIRLPDFVAQQRRLTLAGLFQDSLGDRDVGALGAFTKVIFGTQRGQLLRHRDVDELVKSDAFTGRHTLCLF